MALANGVGEEGTAPIVDDDVIMLNGVGDNAHETFYITREGVEGFNFTKTAYKHYDFVVTAILIVVNYHAPEALEISSDGRREDWEDGLAYARVTLPALGSLQIPEGIRE